MFVLCYFQMVDLDLPRIVLTFHMRYLIVHNKGQLFGYFIASSYSCPFLLAIFLVQVPTPSFVAVCVFLVGDADLFTGPFRYPTLPLPVVVAFFMRYIFWQRVGKAISAKRFAMWTVIRVDVPFIRLPVSASPCTRFAVISWRRTAR